MRDRVEIDYSRRLTDEHQVWLAHFNESEYGANPDCLEHITGEPITREHRRKVWRETQYANRNNPLIAPRVDIDAYQLEVDMAVISTEDALIECIDTAEIEVEVLALENLRFLILRRYWQVA